MKNLPFSHTTIMTDIYRDLKEDDTQSNYKMWLNDELIDFFSCWLMQTNHPGHINATEIMNTLLVGSIEQMFQFKDSITTGKKNEKWLRLAMKQIDQFLDTHSNLFSKKFIFYPVNERRRH